MPPNTTGCTTGTSVNAYIECSIAGAARAPKAEIYITPLNLASLPKGCSYNPAYQKVYFNTHPTGSSNPSYAPACSYVIPSNATVYPTYAKAKDACRASPSCTGVHDPGCDETGGFTVCETPQTGWFATTDASSCVRQQPLPCQPLFKNISFDEANAWWPEANALLKDQNNGAFDATAMLLDLAKVQTGSDFRTAILPDLFGGDCARLMPGMCFPGKNCPDLFAVANTGNDGCLRSKGSVGVLGCSKLSADQKVSPYSTKPEALFKGFKQIACQKAEVELGVLKEKLAVMYPASARWEGWKLNDQMDFLTDVYKLSKIASAEHVFGVALGSIFSIPPMTAGGGDDTKNTKDTSNYMTKFAQRLMRWPVDNDSPNSLLPLALTLHQACQVRTCPTGVLIAAQQIISKGVADPKADLIPSALTLVKSFHESSVLKEAIANTQGSQPRTCYAHGCIAASDDKIVTVKIVDTATVNNGLFVHVDAAKAVDSHGIRGSSTTLHWLWRLQSAAGSDEETWDGVSFDVFTIDNTAVRVYVRTKQSYEPFYTTLCWAIFTMRLLAFIVIDGIVCATVLTCQDGEDLDTLVEIPFLECTPSRNTYMMMGVLLLLDYGNILNPVFNLTAVQQGEFKWAAQNEYMSDLIGYTACKLELALVPAIISVIGRMVTCDGDTGMEVFWFQMGILVAPIVLGKMGYGFELNTSTLLTMMMTVTVIGRYKYRQRKHPEYSYTRLCSDATMKTILSKEAEGEKNTEFLVALGERTKAPVDLDTFSSLRVKALGLFAVNTERPRPKKRKKRNVVEVALRATGDDDGEEAAVSTAVSGGTDAAGDETAAHDGGDTVASSVFSMIAKVDQEGLRVTLLPIVVMIILQVSAILGSSTHPITMLENDAAVSKSVLDLAAHASRLKSIQALPDAGWPFPGTVATFNAEEGTDFLGAVIGPGMSMSDFGYPTTIGHGQFNKLVCYKFWQPTAGAIGVSFTKPTDYWLINNASTRSCTRRASKLLRVSNITGAPGKRVFETLSDKDVQAWFETVSIQAQDQFKMHELTRLADDLIALKRSQSFQKELLPELMVNGPVCTRGYNGQGTDFTSWSYNSKKAKQHANLWKAACANWNLQLKASNVSLQSSPAWPAWSRADQTAILLDVLKLATIVNAGTKPLRVLVLRITFFGIVDSTISKSGIDGFALYNNFNHLTQWQAPNRDPADNVALPLALWAVCKKKQCPDSVLIAAANGIAGHNVDPESGKSPRYGLGTLAPNLPSTSDMANYIRETFFAPKVVAATQARTCMVHGCLAAASDRIMTISVGKATEGNVVTLPGTDKKFVKVSTDDIKKNYKTRGADAKTLHWLWRLQSAAGAVEGNHDGVAFDLYTIGTATTRVLVQTKQQYEASWLNLCWFIFVGRVLLFMLVDCGAGSTTIVCRREGSTDEAELDFFECCPSRQTYVTLFLLTVLDFGNLLNPMLNLTAVQQGEFQWVAKNKLMSDLLGYTGCKIELALVPSVISVVGRVLTGVVDAGMEIFSYQMGVFVAPLILGKLGYGFTVNTSSLLTVVVLISVAVRYAYRRHVNPGCAIYLATDDTMEGMASSDDPTLYHIVMGMPIEEEAKVERDLVCAWRALVAGLARERSLAENLMETGEEIGDDLGELVDDVMEEMDDLGDHIEDGLEAIGVIDAEDGLTREEFEQLAETVVARFDFDGTDSINAREDFAQAVVALLYKLPSGTPTLPAPEVDSKAAAACAGDDAAEEWTLVEFQDWFEQNVLVDPLVD